MDSFLNMILLFKINNYELAFYYIYDLAHKYVCLLDLFSIFI